MESIDRLRDWLRGRLLLGNGWNELNEIADAIEREGMEERTAAYNEGYDAGFASADDWAAQHEDAMAEHGWVPLPLDADGVPIHVGDVVAATLAHGGSGRWVVDRMELTRAYDQDLWQIALDKDGACWVTPPTVRHHHESTVEDVLREVVTLCHNTWKEGSAFHFYDVDDVMESGNIAEYAAKLRLVGDE